MAAPQLPSTYVADLPNQRNWDYTNKYLAAQDTRVTVLETPTATVTSLPGSPVDGQQIYYVADATNGIVWHFRYNSASASSYKWEFLGGPPMWSEITTSETTASTTYTALATAGPSIALPLAGDYDVTISAALWSNSSGVATFMSYDIGATGAVDSDSVFRQEDSTGNTGIAFGDHRRRKTGLTAVTLTAKYKTGGAGTSTFQARTMAAVPIRVG